MSEISIENIAEGDELLIKNNQIIPVDGVLTSRQYQYRLQFRFR